ncbi:DUF2785 domain-containing protein [Myxococcota bacterium]|nr:DUF2785 domain-containing protein [Myxococcota bacterium]
MWIFVAALALAQPPAGEGVCPPPGATRASLLELRARAFVMPAAAERDALALALVACVDSPDPKLRDGVAFEGISTWLRSKALSRAAIVGLHARLVTQLSGPRDAAGFRHPFATLVLAEVARADRLDPVLTDAARASLVELAARTLRAVDDYRGFDPTEGWRHGVAHGADLVLQLALSPKLGADAHATLMTALATQIAPKGHAYVFGEPERLARAVVYTHERGRLDAAFWKRWFDAVASPAPLASWGSAFESTEGLARRHDTLAFLHAVAFASRQTAQDALAKLADEALARVHGG